PRINGASSPIISILDIKIKLISYMEIDGRGIWALMDFMPNRIKLLRELKGWPMQRLAEEVWPPTTAAQINKLEKGQRQLTYDWIQRLAKALGVSPYDITGDAAPAMPAFEDLSKKEKDLIRKYRALREQEQDAFDALLKVFPARSKKKR